MPQLPGPTHAGEAPRLIARAIVGEESPDGNPAAPKPHEGVPEKRGARAPALRPTDFDKRDPRRIVNRHVDILVADAAVLDRPVAMNAMADAANPAEGLDVQVKEVAGVRPLVALNDGGRLQASRDSGRRAARHA
jgi:hypothetical protein